MASELKDELTCSICINLYTDPVTLPCGHNFCQECIKVALDTQAGSRAYTCPQCRAVFPERPMLQRNTTLCNIAEHLLSQEGDCQVLCMHCLHPPVVASKTCLFCKVSLCDSHLQGHNKAPEHVLVQPTKSFRNLICSRHNKVFKYYCMDDAECLCTSCSFSWEHRGHQVELLNVSFRKKQERLRNMQGLIIKQGEEIVELVQHLQDHLRNLPEKAAGIVEKVLVHFRDLRMKQDNLEEHLLSEISKQRERASLSISDLIQKLELKKDRLCRKESAIEVLCKMTDPLHYLLADTDDFADLVGNRDWNLKEVDANLVEDLIMRTLNSDLMAIMFELQKGYYVYEASGILLDVNTASNDVHISCDLKTASWTEVNQGRPKTQQRFAIRRVLSTKCFSDGKLYWDVEVSEAGGWRVGMTYPSIGRKGKYSLIGNNDKSWGLRSFHKQYSVRHDRKEIPLARRPCCYKVRIYVDYTAGLLSFYELSNPMRHLYTYNTAFTEELYPVFVVWDHAWVKVLN